MKDFSFNGKVFLGNRLSNGKPGKLRWVDDASTLGIQLTTDKEERQESWSGQRLTSVTIPKAKKARFTLVLNAATAANLALALQTEAQAVTTGSVTGEALPPGLVAGDVVMLDHPRISALTLTDAAKPTPAALVLGTHYRIESAPGGLIEILNPATLVQPFSAAYTHAAYVNLAMFKLNNVERYGVLDGINTVDDERVRVTVYRMKFDPVSDLSLITDSLGNLNLAGDILFDATNFQNANLGGFARVQLPEEV
ncbi:TPA: hypothetical protein SLV86_001318 [Pseudomonas aeruginosa]|nr:hypothetical protein [Pseudomonas aeruginosa]HEJ2039564.1 hypothetical protein [Pseudomonas aeruginosa]